MPYVRIVSGRLNGKVVEQSQQEAERNVAMGTATWVHQKEVPPAAQASAAELPVADATAIAELKAEEAIEAIRQASTHATLAAMRESEETHTRGARVSVLSALDARGRELAPADEDGTGSIGDVDETAALAMIAEAADVEALNAMLDSEQGREGGARDSVEQAINARADALETVG